MQKIVIMFAVLPLVAILSSPSIHEHQEVVKNEWLCCYSSNNLLSKNDSVNQAQSQQGTYKSFINSLVDNRASFAIERRNFLFFSLTSLHCEGSCRTIGIGVFGKVFIQEDMQAMIHPYIVYINTGLKPQEIKVNRV
jgi:hypothetical protein